MNGGKTEYRLYYLKSLIFILQGLPGPPGPPGPPVSILFFHCREYVRNGRGRGLDTISLLCIFCFIR